MNQARIAVDQSGYQYKKGKSRSKVYGEQEESAPPKRPKLDRTLRLERLSQIREEVATISQQISFKEKRIDIGVQTKHFKLCDTLSEEIDDLQKRRRELNAELKFLEKKDKKAQWYQQRKISSSSESEASTSPPKCPRMTPTSSRASSREESEASTSPPTCKRPRMTSTSSRASSREDRESVGVLSEPESERGTSEIPTKQAEEGSGVLSPTSTVQASSTCATVTMSSRYQSPEFSGTDVIAKDTQHDPPF